MITIGVGFNIDGLNQPNRPNNNAVRNRVLNAVYPDGQNTDDQAARKAVKYLITTTGQEAQNDIHSASATLNNPASTQDQRHEAQILLNQAQRVVQRDTLRATRTNNDAARLQRNNDLAALFNAAVSEKTNGRIATFNMTGTSGNDQTRTVFDGLMDTNDTALRNNTPTVTWHCFEEKVNYQINRRSHPQTSSGTADYTTQVIGNSYERVVLASLAYNNPELLGNNLSAAFNTQRTTNGVTDVEGLAQDRAEAWYEIRYNSGNQYKRRIIESEVFGLYENAASVSAEDARGVYSVYTKHNRQGNGSNANYMNTAWDTAQNRAFTLANGDITAINTALNNTNVAVTIPQATGLQEQLNAARDAIVADLNTNHGLNLTASDFTSTDIFAVYTGYQNVVHTSLNGSAANNILLGNTSVGYEGTTNGVSLARGVILDGLDGNDILVGSIKDDDLSGGG